MLICRRRQTPGCFQSGISDHTFPTSRSPTQQNFFYLISSSVVEPEPPLLAGAGAGSNSSSNLYWMKKKKIKKSGTGTGYKLICEVPTGREKQSYLSVNTTIPGKIGSENIHTQKFTAKNCGLFHDLRKNIYVKDCVCAPWLSYDYDHFKPAKKNDQEMS